jgi:hypothetical protein
VGIWAALRNPELYECFCGQLRDEITIEKTVDYLRFLTAIRCRISAALEFIASHLQNFMLRPDGLKDIRLSQLDKMVGYRSLEFETRRASAS